MKTAVVMSEDAAWTKPLDAGYLECLPKIGLKVLDEIRFSPDTTDFTPIFNKIEGLKPDVIITGISHVGVQPTVQWKSQQVPIPMFGVASQATNSTFWKDTNGATEGVLYQGVSGPGVAVTEKTLPFVDAFVKKYGNTPSYAGYTAYDDVYIIADAVKRAGSTDSDKLVTAMEATDYVGTIGRVQFLPKGDPHVHGLRDRRRFHHRPVPAMAERRSRSTCGRRTLAKGKLTFPSFREGRGRRTDAAAGACGASSHRHVRACPGHPRRRRVRRLGQDEGALPRRRGCPGQARLMASARQSPSADIRAVLANPDRRLRDLLALCAGRDRLHADLRRDRRAQPLARRADGRGRGRRPGRPGSYCGLRRLCRARLSASSPAWRWRSLTYLPDRPAAAAHAQDPRGGEGDLHPHGDAALGHHDPGGDRLSLHQQRQDGAADRRRRGRARRRAHAEERDVHRRLSAGSRSSRCGWRSTARAPARSCWRPR